MKISSLSKGLALLILLSAVAFASNRGLVRVSTTVMVNGKPLPAGEYAVQWEGTGAEVQVSFLKGKNVVVTAPARVVELANLPANDTALIKKNDDGSSSLAQIRFGGKKQALALDGAAPQS